MKQSKEFIVEGIKNLLRRNYNIETQTIDVEALVDSSLSFGENWTIIKEEYISNTNTLIRLRCNKCEKLIKDDWNYCPICSNNLKGGKR